LVDQSGSMGCPFDSPEPCESPPTGLEPSDPSTRWSQLRTALLAETGPIFQLQAEVNFGLQLYGDDGPQAEVCPQMTPAVVNIAKNNYLGIKTTYLSATTKAGTPTPQGLQRAVEALQGPGRDPLNPKYVVLATDGNPGSCDCTELIQSDCNDDVQWRTATETIAGEGFAGGVKTFVIGVGKGQVDQGHLQRLALKGQGLPETTTEQKFYEVGNATELIAAFNSIIFDGVRSCVIDLDATVAPADAPKGKVTLGGQPVTYGDANGWKLLPSNDQIEFVGAACTKVKDAATKIDVSFQCGSNVVPKPPR
ncbi:MAG: VWA domain-containing protein, partial [Polyangiaceae bacterium]|nr:VWA domain-containing protein [Polyangiaceae bacterium]